jgi:hypothetical protein
MTTALNYEFYMPKVGDVYIYQGATIEITAIWGGMIAGVFKTCWVDHKIGEEWTCSLDSFYPSCRIVKKTEPKPLTRKVVI